MLQDGHNIERFNVVRGFWRVIALLRRFSGPVRASLRCIKLSNSCFASGVVTTAPPKPSVQTQILLSHMEERAQVEDAHWDHIGDVENHQQRMETQFDVSTRVMEQMLFDQQSLAKHIETTSNAVAQLTLNQMRSRMRDLLVLLPAIILMMWDFTSVDSTLLGVQHQDVLVFHHTDHLPEIGVDSSSKAILGIFCPRCSSLLLMVSTRVSGKTSVKIISRSLIFHKLCGLLLHLYTWMIRLLSGSRCIN